MSTPPAAPPPAPDTHHAGDTEAGDVPTVVGLHTAPGRRLPARSRISVEAEAGVGLVGDRYHGSRHRHVTVQSAEELAEAAAVLGREIPYDGTRRNLTISRGQVPTAPGSRIRIGPVDLEVVRVAAPCRLLDDILGPGGAAALRRRAGSVCRVLVGGTISLGDPVELMPPPGAEDHEVVRPPSRAGR